MANAMAILADLPRRYVPGKVDRAIAYYFSVGEHKYTVTLTPTACEVVPGNAGNADCIIKADPAVFENLVLHGKAPGALDIARGRFKTNDVGLLMHLRDCFRP